MKICHFVFVCISVILILSQSAFIQKVDVGDINDTVQASNAVFDYSAFLENPVDEALTFEGFAPKAETDYITAGEAVIIVSRLYAYLNGGDFFATYSSNLYDKYYLFAENNGIIKKGEFHFSDRNITRDEFAYLIYPLCKNEVIINEIFFLPDVMKGNLYCEEVFNMYRIGLTDGMDAYGVFMPDLEVSVLQCNTIIDRYVNISKRLRFSFSPLNDSFVIDFDSLLQNPSLPTGCEVTSLASVLNYYGFEIDKGVLADDYLPKGEIGKTDPNVAFVGNPRHSSGFGCFAPVILECANTYFDSVNVCFKAYDSTGSSLDNLMCEIEKTRPVIVWSTMYLIEPYISNIWNIDGEEVPWIANEHCVVLTGFDKNQGVVYVMDPLRGNVKYDLELFNKRFEELGKQSVIIK